MYGTIFGRKAGQTMQIFAYSSNTATNGAYGTLIDADTALSWLSVEVAFANGVIESVAAENGLTATVNANNKEVGVGDLTGSGVTHPAGLVMTVTFTPGTDMSSVFIDFSSSITAIVHSTQPTVSFTSTPRVATVVQDKSNNLYLFASPNTPTDGQASTIEIAVTGAFAESDITSVLDGLTPQGGSGYFGLGFLDGVSKLPDGEAIAVTSRPLLDIDVDSVKTAVVASPVTPAFDAAIFVIGAALPPPTPPPASSTDTTQTSVAAGHPRVELHVHLDGSIPPETLLRVARRRGLSLPGIRRVPEDVDDVWTALRSMNPVWHMFDLVNKIIGGDEATLVEIAEDFVDRQAAQSVSYNEVRWDPVRPAVSHLANASISVLAAVRAVERGLRAGAERHGIEVHQLLCAMRGSPGAACFDIARLVAATRSGALGGVVGMDIAGDELHFNNSVNQVEQCFAYAKRELLLNTTVHAGESYTSLRQSYTDELSAIQVMHADRVGHGYASTQDDATLALLARSRVHLEACPAGGHGSGVNLRATGVYRQRGLSFGMSTDDPTAYFSNVTLPQVEALVRRGLGFTDEDISRAYRDAAAASFARDAARIAAMMRGGPAAADPGGEAGGASARGEAARPGAGLIFLMVLGALVGVASLAFLAYAVLGRAAPKPPGEVTMTRAAI